MTAISFREADAQRCPSCGHAYPAGAAVCEACGMPSAVAPGTPTVEPSPQPPGLLPDAAPVGTRWHPPTVTSQVSPVGPATASSNENGGKAHRLWSVLMWVILGGGGLYLTLWVVRSSHLLWRMEFIVVGKVMVLVALGTVMAVLVLGVFLALDALGFRGVQAVRRASGKAPQPSAVAPGTPTVEPSPQPPGLLPDAAPEGGHHMDTSQRPQQEEKESRCKECGKLLVSQTCYKCRGSGRTGFLIFKRACKVCGGDGIKDECPYHSGKAPRPSSSITGEARGIQQQTLNHGVNWTFRVERYDPAGNWLPPVPVQMGGNSFLGFINEGDWVEVPDECRRGGLVRTTWLHNLTTDSVFQVVPYRRR